MMSFPAIATYLVPLSGFDRVMFGVRVHPAVGVTHCIGAYCDGGFTFSFRKIKTSTHCLRIK